MSESEITSKNIKIIKQMPFPIVKIKYAIIKYLKN